MDGFMISLDEAQARLFALRGAVEAQEVPLAEAVGRWSAADAVALRTQPARDLSAMDGYAIRAADRPGPWTVIGESAAGRQFTGSVKAGQAVRIFTGAVVPEGADCILIQENAARNGNTLTLTSDMPTPGRHIRRAGADFAEGAVLVKAGQWITPPRIGLAAMGGHATLTVRRKLRVAIISTGDELVPPGVACAEDQIPSSNTPMLAAMLAAMPVEVDVRALVRDNLVELTAEFAACDSADVIVSIGGASVGDHDLVRPALIAAGATLDFWKIAIRPGKPVMAGMLGNSVVLGLPGNPVSAYVTAMLLLKPLIAHLGGSDAPLPTRINAHLGAALPENGDRIDHIRAILNESVAMPIGRNDSSLLSAMSASNALIIRDINSAPASVGDIVQCYKTNG
jgi:molybdopterin molybdotransferase